MPNYRVRRDLPGNSYVQLKSSTLPECKALLKSLRDKWEDLADTGTFGGGQAYSVDLGGMALVVKQGEKIVDRYVIEVV